MISDPLDEDCDKDGLLDGKPIKVGDKIIAPKDQRPFIIDGPEGVWKKQIEIAQNSNIPNDYNYDSKIISDLINKSTYELPSNINDYIDIITIISASGIVNYGLKNRDLILENKDKAREFALKLKAIINISAIIAESKGMSAIEAEAAVGAYILDFRYDEDNIAYHSSVDNWQRIFGYNDMYDDVFTIGSNMLKEKFEFSYNETDYILWAWKGDYWNLGSGTEIGLYDYNRTFDGTPHYDVVDFELPMTLNLYNYHSKDSIENIFCWAPDEQDEKQWWITGFNPDFYFPKNL